MYGDYNSPDGNAPDPKDFKEAEPETTTCPMCDHSVLIKHTVRDPKDVPICDTKDCIEESRLSDLYNNAPSKADEINKHYDNLLTQLK